MKRIFAAALAAAMLASLCACGAQKQEADPELNLQPLAPVETAEPASISDANTLPREAPASDSDIVVEREIPEKTPEPAETPEAEAAVQPEETPVPQTAQPEEPAADLQTRIETAKACIGLRVDELVAVLGEPVSSEYAASCEVDNAEDGMLFYDGFYVWTLRTEAEEVVRNVYLDE